MNKVQRYILSAGLGVLAILCLFPPWTYTTYLTGTRDTPGFRSEKNAGYHFIFSPPKPERDALIYGVKLDVARLSLELLSVVSVSAVAIISGKFVGGKPQNKFGRN